MREHRWGVREQGERAPALTVELCAGIPDAVDEAAASGAPSHAFLRAAWFEGAGGEQASTLVARRPDGRTIAALPTVRLGSRWPVGRKVPGSYWPFRSFPLAADIADGELAAFLAGPEAAKALGPLWRLGPVYADDPVVERLSRLGAGSGWRVLRRSLGTCFIVDLPRLLADGPWPRSKTLRKNRWLERRLAEEGELAFSAISGAGWTDALFDTLAGIERNSWVAKKTGGADTKFAAGSHRRFWEAAARDPALSAGMRASLLHVGGIPAAFAFSLQAGATRYYVANGYDERFAERSPGRALLYRDFQQAIETGTERIAWGAGDSGYKQEMGATPGPEIVDLLFVRSRALTALIRPLWRA